VTALRYRRRLLELDNNSNRVALSEWLPLERNLLKSETVPFTLVLRKDNETTELRCRRRFRLPGQQWRWSDVWELVPRSASCDSLKLNDVSFRLVAPENDEDNQQWHVFEGRRWAASVQQRPQHLTDLHGWGAPLTLRSGPYNSVEPDQPLLRCIVNHGVLQRVTVLANGAVRLSLARRIEPDDRHELLILSEEGLVWRTSVEHVQNDGRNTAECASASPVRSSWYSDFDVADDETCATWHASLPKELDVTTVVATAIAYDGEWLGSRWTEEWPMLLQSSAAAQEGEAAHRLEDIADVLRWFHLPLVAPDHIDNVRRFGHAFPVAVLFAWLGCRSDSSLSSVILDEGWLGVVRDVFKDWRPTGLDASDLRSRFEHPSTGPALPLGATASKLSQVHPLLAARVVEAWLNSDEAAKHSSKERRVLPWALKDQILRGESHDGLVRRVAQDVARSAEPPDGTIDFVSDPRDGLLEKALKLFRNPDSRDVTVVDHGNIDVAMRLDAFRTLVLSACLERIGKDME